MAHFQVWAIPQTVEEAWQLCQSKTAVPVAGNMWVRVCGLRKKTAVDLSSLNLTGMEDDGEKIICGAMTSLRELETDPALPENYRKAFQKAFSPIIGVQFRNTATLGGSLCGRFGFSDVGTLFLALDAELEFYHGGTLPLSGYQAGKPTRDILMKVHFRKDCRIAYEAARRSGTDFPLLTACAVRQGERTRLVLGARPGRAAIAGEESVWNSQTLEKALQSLTFDGNRRASKEYRMRIAPVLSERVLKEIGCWEE